MKSHLLCSLLLVISFSAQAYSSVEDLRDCVSKTKYVDGFTQENAAKLCRGVKNVQSLRDCASKAKYIDGFTQNQVVDLCGQQSHAD